MPCDGVDSANEAVVGREDHEEQHRDGHEGVGPRGPSGLLRGGRCVGVGLAAPGDGLGVADHDLLVAPDHAPHVEEHRDAEEHAGHDRRALEALQVVGVLLAGVDADEDDAEGEREQRRVPEPPQGPERELAQRLGASAVAQLGVGRHLHHVEEVQEADPGDAGEDVSRASEHLERAVRLEEVLGQLHFGTSRLGNGDPWRTYTREIAADRISRRLAGLRDDDADPPRPHGRGEEQRVEAPQPGRGRARGWGGARTRAAGRSARGGRRARPAPTPGRTTAPRSAAWRG